MQRPLPALALVLIGIATGLLWIGVLIGLLAFAVGGGLPILDDLFVWGTAQGAYLLQYGVVAFGYLGVLVMGTWTLIVRFSSGAEPAGGVAVILVRVMMAFSVLNLFATSALMWSFGGLVSALPGIISNLPMTLVTLAMLICANAYLSRDLEDVFG